jgi:Uncharacterised nucleotidyltransferase
LPAVDDRSLASHLLGRAVLDAAVRVLEPLAIAVMPLKGIWLQEFVYADPRERRITDVDVLVPDGQHPRALAALKAAGWQFQGGNVAEVSFIAPGLPLPLDLHAALFAHGAFRMPVAALFERGRAGAEAFGTRVHLPDPLDVFAHLVGHFVKGRGGRDSEARALRDFPAFLARYAFAPETVARHLQRCGMARASRYALQCVPEELDSNRGCRAVLDALDADVVGSACATAMLALRNRVSSHARVAMLPGFVLDRSLLRGARSAALRAVDRARGERRE